MLLLLTANDCGFSGSADVQGSRCHFCYVWALSPFHALRFLQLSVPDSSVSPVDTPFDPVSSICPALASDDSDFVHGLHLPSLCIGICVVLLLIPLCEAILTARIVAFRAALRRFGYEEHAPLYRLL